MDTCEFKASLVYKTTQRHPISQKMKQKIKIKNLDIVKMEKILLPIKMFSNFNLKYKNLLFQNYPPFYKK